MNWQKPILVIKTKLGPDIFHVNQLLAGEDCDR